MRFCFTLTVLLFAYSAFAQVNLSKGLAAYYPFDGDAKDESGNNNHPVYNNATLTSGHTGIPKTAMYFNGRNTYIKIPDAPSLNMKNKMSISLWVKPTGYYTGTCYNNMLIMKGNTDYLDGIYFIRFSDTYTGCDNPSTDQERFYATGVVAPTPFVKLGQWYHVVWTYDGYTARLYINCELKESKRISLTFTNDYDLYMGRMNDPQYPYWFNGSLDEVRIYNRALNTDEISALCKTNAKTPVPCIGVNKPDASFTLTLKDCNTATLQFKTAIKKDITSIRWAFGDGTVAKNTSPSHFYAKAGTYTVKAILTNNKGCSDTFSKKIRIEDLKTDFVFQEKGKPGEIEFRSTSNRAAYAWDFGNGNSAENESSKTISYNESGDYIVTMTARNAYGCTDTVQHNLHIELPLPPSQTETTIPETIIPQSFPVAQLPEQRENELQQVIQTKNDSLTISIYDNGVIDGDSVTIVFNNKIIAEHLLLGSQPVVFRIPVSKEKAANELLMYAENLGTIPPNTAMMVVTDGDKKYFVSISSTKKTNGVISFVLKE